MMKGKKLTSKILLAVLLAASYGVANAENITATGPWRVKAGETLTGYENITITGWSEISGKLGDYVNKNLGANTFETGNFRLNTGGEIYVGTLITDSRGQDNNGNDIMSNIYGKIYAANINFNNETIGIQKGAEIYATENFEVTVQKDNLINAGLINVGNTFKLNGNKLLLNNGTIEGNKITVGMGEVRNNGTISIKDSLEGGKITNNSNATMKIGEINAANGIENFGQIEGADGIENVSIIVSDDSGEIINNGKININGKIQTENGKIYNTDNLTAGTIITKGQVRNDVNGSITITDTINANNLYNSGSVSGAKLITPGGLTNGGYSAGTNPDASLDFDDIDTRYIINAGKIKAQTIENDLNISNMGEMTVSGKMTVDGVLKNTQDGSIIAKDITIKQDSQATSGETTSFNKGNMSVSGTMTLEDGANFLFENGEGTNVSISNLQGVGSNAITVAEGTTGIDITNANMVNGEFTMLGGEENKLTIGTLDGNGNTFYVESLTPAQVTIGTNKSTGLTVIGTGDLTDSFGDNLLDGLQSLSDTLKVNTPNGERDLIAAAGAVTGEITAKTDEWGKVIWYTEGVNAANSGISEMATIALMSWRAENNDMNKRLGELRDSNGEHGVWARMVRGERDYRSIDYQYNNYQLGYDEKLSTNDKWTVGGAITYTEGDAGFNMGSAETKHTGFAMYGSYLNDDGSFIDLIAKYARLEHEFDVMGGAGKGDYNTNGYSVSAEYGKRFTQDSGLWIEPQVELTYGKVGSVNYVTSNDVNVRQDGMESLVGRVGFTLGKDFKQGNAYVRASYLYDFEGETNVYFSKNGAHRSFEQDLGGGWWEVGIGTNINFSDATYLYFDVEKTYGGEVATPWQWNLGVRYSF